MAIRQESFLVKPATAQNPKSAIRVFLMMVILASFAGFVYAHDPQYDEHNNSFRAGYTAGYGHGNAYQQTQSTFNFRHDREYQMRTDDRRYQQDDHNNNDSRQDLNFRLGYVEGYADGYFRQNPLFAFQQQDASNGHYDQNYGSNYQGGITVYTETRYQGYGQEFRIGQYSSLEGRLDDDIQSIRVNGSLRVVLFEDNKFRGKSIVIDRDTWDLGNFKKKAGSMIIEPIRYGQIR